MQCINNLKQTGSRPAQLPRAGNDFSQSGFLSLTTHLTVWDSRGGPGWDWASFSLNQMEHLPGYNSINFVLGIEVRGFNQTARLTAPWLAPLPGRRLTVRILHGRLIRRRPARCPRAADPARGLVKLRRSVGSGDPSSLYPYPTVGDGRRPGRDNGNGLFFRNHSINIAQILDCTSQTFAAGERSQNRSRAIWAGAITNAAVPLVALQAEAGLDPEGGGARSSRTPAKGTGPIPPPVWPTATSTVASSRRANPLRRRQCPIHQGADHLQDLSGPRDLAGGEVLSSRPVLRPRLRSSRSWTT